MKKTWLQRFRNALFGHSVLLWGYAGCYLGAIVHCYRAVSGAIRGSYRIAIELCRVLFGGHVVLPIELCRVLFGGHVVLL